ncbi:MAG: hypothetical protein V3T88_04825 [Nitrosomonadaceae bacterium]
MNYLQWNEAICKYFFNSDNNGIRVFLYSTKDVIDAIGRTYNVDLDDFIGAVKVGPHWIIREDQSICQHALQAFHNWRERELDYPPYLCYLAFFVLADTVETGFARHSYYPGIRLLLGEELKIGTYPSFGLMYILWDDLAIWSNQDKHGEWGIFDADIVGEWVHVGLPRAQTLLTEEERVNLPLIFADCSFDPHSPPSDQELTYLLAEDQFHRLRPHTKELLKSTSGDDQHTRDALIEVLLDELQQWDGSVPLTEEPGDDKRRSLGNIRLIMVFDSIAKTARISFRCRSNREYPEEGLQFTGESIPGTLYCYEDWQGWSTILTEDEEQTVPYDVSELDWLSGLTISDHDHAWRVSLAKRPVRVMINAKSYGFDGFVEESQLPKGKGFYLLANGIYADLLNSWGQNSCKGFRQLDIISGLPQGWNVFGVDEALSDAIICETFPYLSLPTTLRIQLRGGLKVKGNQYFTFALPHIEVTGIDENIRLFCNDYPLSLDQGTGLYNIPKTLSASKLIIEARRNSECICKKTLYTLATMDWRDIEDEMYIDKFGKCILDRVDDSCVGPLVKKYVPPEFHPEFFLPQSDGSRIYYIGRNPGEISIYPKELLPKTWSPIWAVFFRRRKGYAVYCATDQYNSTPTMDSLSDRKRVKKWKKLLWYYRSRIEPPNHPVTRQLWSSYKKLARRVR